MRRAFEEEMVEFRSMDLHSYTKTCGNIRKDFKKLINSKDENEVNSMLEKYEFYIENSYKINAYTRNKINNYSTFNLILFYLIK